MKRIYLSVLILLSINSFAKQVDPATAKTVAANHLQSHSNTLILPGQLRLVDLQSGAVDRTKAVPYYVFSTATSFVIIAGDDRVQPVLAYSTESSFASTCDNNPTGYILDCYEKQINEAIARNIQPSAKTIEQWTDLKNPLRTWSPEKAGRTTAVAPLVKTRWNQSPFVNDLCPYDPLAQRHAVTGCVATAMSQMMKYWNWPRTGTGNHTYTDVLYGPQGVNYSATTYDWSAMRDTVNAPDTAVAQLMYSAGVSVNMDYGVNGSGAWVVPGDSIFTNVAAFALKTYFHYKPSLRAVARWGNDLTDSFSNSQWVGMLEAELNAGRPVFYTGFTPTEGHCWICDGYSSDSFFHFNWGWGGYSDGYFTLNNLVDGLNLGQEAIFGIMPDSFPVYREPIALASYLTSTSSPATYGEPILITASITNHDNTNFTGDICAQVFDTAGVLQGTIQTISGVTIAQQANSGMLTFSTKGLYQLIAGNYTIHLCYRPSGTDTWLPVGNNGNFINYSVMTIANDTNMMLYDNFRITSDSLRRGLPLSVDAFVTDLGLTRFTGWLDLSLYDMATGEHVYTIGKVNHTFMNTNKEYNFTFSNNQLMVLPGTYIMMLKHQYNDSGAFYITGSAWKANPVKVTVAGHQMANSSEVNIYPNPAKDVIYIDPYTNNIKSIRIMDMRGVVVATLSNPEPNTILPISLQQYPQGMYFMKIETQSKVSTHKFTVYR